MTKPSDSPRPRPSKILSSRQLAVITGGLVSRGNNNPNDQGRG